jgi:hypothetical protein
MFFYGRSPSVRILAACWATLLASPLAASADPAATGTIAVRQTVQCCYREGSVSFVVIRQVGNDNAAVKVSRLLPPLAPTLIVGTELSPGRYIVQSFQRPCDGNCNFLNPPVDQCNSGPLELRAGTEVSLLVSVIPFGGCSISTEDVSI